jgi:hypothetical protein
MFHVPAWNLSKHYSNCIPTCLCRFILRAYNNIVQASSMPLRCLIDTLTSVACRGRRGGSTLSYIVELSSWRIRISSLSLRAVLCSAIVIGMLSTWDDRERHRVGTGSENTVNNILPREQFSHPNKHDPSIFGFFSIPRQMIHT